MKDVLRAAGLSGTFLSLAACATIAPDRSVERMQDFQFSPQPDGAIMVDAFLYFPKLETLEAMTTTDSMYIEAAHEHCQGEFKEISGIRWCHAGQPKDLPGTLMTVCKTIRCAGAAQ